MSISLTIDYSNGAVKSFGHIDFHDGMTVLDVLRATQSIAPGLDFAFHKTFTDRGGREVGFISSVDGVDTMDSDREWQLWVNVEPVEELRQPTPLSSAQFDFVTLKDGDSISLKLTASVQKV